MEFLRCQHWMIVADYRFSRPVAPGQRSQCACLMPSPKTSDEQGEFSSDGHVKVAVRQASHHPTRAQSIRLIFGEPVRPKSRSNIAERVEVTAFQAPREPRIQLRHFWNRAGKSGRKGPRNTNKTQSVCQSNATVASLHRVIAHESGTPRCRIWRSHGPPITEQSDLDRDCGAAVCRYCSSNRGYERLS
jgi:hypothetical protein